MPWDQKSILRLVALLPVLLLSLTVHEFAHARTALAFGDPTAKRLGRCSLNPLRHLDPLGTIVLIVTQLIGWAKPVPVNPHNLHPRRMGDIAVSLAGPLSNLSLAIVAALLLRVLLATAPQNSDSELVDIAVLQLFMLFSVNLALFTFNLLPLWPLDGHHVVRELLPLSAQGPFMRWQVAYGRFALAALILVPFAAREFFDAEVFDPVYWILIHVRQAAMGVLGL